MAVFDNLNYTHSPGVAPSVQEYFNAKLQKYLMPELVHARFAQKVRLPKHNGKFVRFRKPIRLEPITTPLSEGVTPEGQKIEMTDFRVTVKPYGGYIALTDEVDLYLLDNQTKLAADLLTDQATLSLDTILRNDYHTGCNVFYAGGKTSRAALTPGDVLTEDMLKRVVRTMEDHSVPKLAGGYYGSIIHPFTKYDLTAFPAWLDKAKYQTTEDLEKYEVGRMYGIRFFESPNAMVFRAGKYLFGTVASLTASSVDVAKKTLTVTAGHAAITPDVARELAGKLVDVKASSSATEQASACIEYVTPSDGKSAVLHLRYPPEGITLAANAVVIPTGGGAGGMDVYSTLVFGANAFGCVALDGTGDNVESILMPPGSSGAIDPLKQRGTAAWKAKGFGGAILDDIRAIRMEHAVSD